MNCCRNLVAKWSLKHYSVTPLTQYLTQNFVQNSFNDWLNFTSREGGVISLRNIPTKKSLGKASLNNWMLNNWNNLLVLCTELTKKFTLNSTFSRLLHGTLGLSQENKGIPLHLVVENNFCIHSTKFKIIFLRWALKVSCECFYLGVKWALCQIPSSEALR